MNACYLAVCRTLAGVALLVCSLSIQAEAKPELTVAISLDIPPYVMNQASSGLEVDIVRQALAQYALVFVQLPYGALQSAVASKRADVSVGVEAAEDGGFYSVDFITFANYAISKKADQLTINQVDDLQGHRVLAWQNAYQVLGARYQQLFSPRTLLAKDYPQGYAEVADQAEQVMLFWQGHSDVTVIDRSIFNHFSKMSGHGMADVSLHGIFPPVTHYKVSFRTAQLRDQFNQGWQQLCKSGGYDALLTRYEVAVEHALCGGLK